MGRGILRNRDSTGVFLLFVPDRDTAEDPSTTPDA